MNNLHAVDLRITSFLVQSKQDTIIGTGREYTLISLLGTPLVYLSLLNSASQCLVSKSVIAQQKKEELYTMNSNVIRYSFDS